ncbi:MAG: tetratricopeptide repeat-containing sensor histidine kinase [Cyclobacteriaceae bacterium]
MNRARLIFITILVACNQLAYAQSSEIDSIKKILPASKGHKHFELLIDLFKENLGINYDSALFYSSSAVKQARLIGDSLAIVKAYNANGFVRMKLGSSLCIPDFEYALEIARRNGYETQVKFLLNNLANSHNDFADYDKALDYHFQSLQLRQLEGKAADISIALNNIGLVYSNLLDYENALSYFQQSKDLKEKNDLSYDLDRAYINIALAHFNLRNYELASENISKVLELCEHGCNDEVQVEAHYALAKISMEKKILTRAREELDNTIKLARRIGSKMYESQALHLSAFIEQEESRPNKALSYLNESQSVLEGTLLRDQTLNNYLLYVSIYNDLGDYQSASEYQQKYIELNKDIFSGDLIKNISRIQTEHEERENIKTIASKNQVLALQEEVIARQKAQYAFIITITFLTLGLAFVMYRANQSQRKINQELAKAKETIQRQNEMLSDANLQLESEVQERTQELVESNESLVKVNDEMDNFIYKTSHDIRGPLASLKGICNVAMMDVKDEAALDYLSKLDTSAAKLNAILSRLLIINQINHSILTPEKINFEEQIGEILELEKKKEMPERIKISYYVAPDLDFRSDKEMAKIILENLIDNAIKYHNDSTRIDPFVKIEIGMEGEWVSAKVIDNGIGIDEESKDKIFQLFVRASERSDSGGIGLYLSKLATVKLGGDIYLSKSKEGYTVFKVLFPPDLVPVIEKRKAEELKREKQKQKVLKVT